MGINGDLCLIMARFLYYWFCK